MTVIKKFSVYSHRNDLGGKVWNPVIRWTNKFAVFVVLEDDQDNSGLGECWCFDTAPDSLVAYLRTEVAPNFVDMDIDDYEDVSERLKLRATLTARHGIITSALSGVDIAVWDLRSQLADQPLWAHLNTTGNGNISLYGSGGLYGENKDISDLSAEMTEMAAGNFRLLKMKVGALEPAKDLERVRAVTDTLPESINIIVDGVYSYDPDHAQSFYESLPEGRIEAFQSPVPAADLKGLTQLARAGILVMATESEYRQEIHRQLVEDCEIAFLQTAPIASGRISGVRTLSHLVHGTSTRLSLEVSSTAVALMAACQIAAADETVAHVEYHYVHQVFFDDLSLTYQSASNGQFELPTTAGLGITLNYEESNKEFDKMSALTFPDSNNMQFTG